ncbi:hypothetical protein CS542_06140 [Pedobacter sp. IW39]|nr:hypothetical protein CS542_06140 [Pedobacter sp. IW39]
MIHPSDTAGLSATSSIEISYSELISFDNNPQKAFIDADRLIFPIVVRAWQEEIVYADRMRNYKS